MAGKSKRKSGILKEFKEFALKGNVIDLAVGVIIGASFQSIVNSVVADIIMPLVGRLVGNIDYSNLFVILSDTSAGVASGSLDPSKLGQLDYVTQQGLPVLAYGSFITAIINFLIMAFLIFLLVRGINRLKDMKLPSFLHKGEEAEEEEAPPTTKTCPYCKSTVDIEAVRCPFCTSTLTEPEAAE